MTEGAVRWLSLFADVPREHLERDLAFWCEVSGTTAGQPSGDLGEYVPLEPDGGDRHLWLQSVDRREGGWHLDLHVDDVPAAVAEAAPPPLPQAELDRLTDALIEKLKTVYDPEIPVNIADLGLIYDCQVTPLAEPNRYRAEVKMTLTAPGAFQVDLISRPGAKTSTQGP